VKKEPVRVLDQALRAMAERGIRRERVELTLHEPTIRRPDPDADAFYVRFAADEIVDSEEVRPGVIFDFDAAGHVVAIEILDAKEKLSEPAVAAAE
jgi:uncharacterized protein YuzE